MTKSNVVAMPTKAITSHPIKHASHLFLTSKGGVGKSTSCSFFIQWLLHNAIPLKGIDLDPSNQTLIRFTDLPVEKVETLEGGDINQALFDKVVLEIVDRPCDEPVIIDSGASNFISLTSYLQTSSTIELLQENNRQLVFHAIIAGGVDLQETATAAAALLNSFPQTRFVIWLNEYFGSTDIANLSFRDSPIYTNYADRIDGIVTLPAVNRQTFGHDIQRMLTRGQTFQAASKDEKTTLTSKHRLKKIRNAIFSELDVLLEEQDAGLEQQGE